MYVVNQVETARQLVKTETCAWVYLFYLNSRETLSYDWVFYPQKIMLLNGLCLHFDGGAIYE